MSFVRVPPDSTGKKIYTMEHTIGADIVQTQVLHIVDETNPENILHIDQRGSASIRFADGQPTLSGFGALNVSAKKVLGVYESSSGSYDDLFSVGTTVGGSNVYDDIAHGMLLQVDGTNGASVKRTTNRYHYYLPGSANMYIGTLACGDTGKVGNYRKWGAFDDEDGVYFSLEGTTIYATIRSSTSGTIVETKIAKSSWNEDKLDGTGLSGMILDITKINIWWIDYQWLGAGRVRFGVYAPDGSRVVCHHVENAGANALPYMRTGTLPIRTENYNSSATGSPSMLRESCQAMYTEGTPDDYTFWRSSDVTASATATTADTTLIALRSTLTPPGLNHHNSIIAYPETLNVYTDQPVRIDLTQDVTATGGTWTATSGETSIEGSTDTAITGLGLPFKTWFFGPGAHTISISQFFELNDEGIMLNADGTKEVWAFTAKRLGSTNAAVTLNMGYRELW